MRNWDTVTTILGILVIVMPVGFGFLSWKLLGVFVLHSKYEEDQDELARKLCQMDDDIREVRDDIKELLQRTAKNRGERDV